MNKVYFYLLMFANIVHGSTNTMYTDIDDAVARDQLSIGDPYFLGSDPMKKKRYALEKVLEQISTRDFFGLIYRDIIQQRDTQSIKAKN